MTFGEILILNGLSAFENNYFIYFQQPINFQALNNFILYKAKKSNKRHANSTFAIGGVLCSADSFMVAENLYLRMNFCAGMPAHRKSAKRYASCFKRNHSLETAKLRTRND